MEKHWLRIGVMILVLCFAAQGAWAGNSDDDSSEKEVPFDEAELYFELNDTDNRAKRDC